MLTTKKALMDSGYRNYARRVPNNSVLYYPGIEASGSTVVDYSGQANHGTISGAVWKRLPCVLWYQSYDGGDDLVTIPYNTAFNFGSGGFAFECWFRKPAGAPKAIFASTSDFWMGAFTLIGGTMGYFASSNGASWDLVAGDAGPLNGIGSISIVLNVWHHWVFTRNGNVWTGYIDGVQDFTATVAGTLVNLVEAKILGRWGHGSYWFNGDMALQRLYNAGLSADTVLNHYQREKRFFGV